MPADVAIVVTAIVAGFTVFGLVLAWAEFQTRLHRKEASRS
jgi:multisubunit Na+/H+ antiporter MnhC subunit